MYYVEERTTAGTGWMPALYRERPALDKDMRIGKTNARARAQPVEVAPHHRKLSLSHLRNIYGNDATNKGTEQ